MPRRSTPVAVNPKRGDIRSCLDISTGHVTQRVMQGIATIPGVIADPTPFGAWLWVRSDVERRIDEEDAQIPRCIIDIWRHARSLGCDYVHLDRDADINPKLPTYDW